MSNAPLVLFAALAAAFIWLIVRLDIIIVVAAGVGIMLAALRSKSRQAKGQSTPPD